MNDFAGSLGLAAAAARLRNDQEGMRALGWYADADSPERDELVTGLVSAICWVAQGGPGRIGEH